MRGWAGYLGFRSLQWVLARLPRPAGYALAIVVSRLALVTARKARRRLEENLGQVEPGLSTERLRTLVRLNFRFHAKAYADLMRLPRVPVREMQPLLTLDGVDNLEASLARGKGVLVVAAHLGSWEIVAAIWASSFAPVWLFAEEVEPRALFEWYRRTRARLGIRVVPLGRRGLHQVVDALRRGEVVITAIDRDLTGTGVLVPFFGRPARIPAGPAAMALRLGTPLLPVCVYRQEDDRYRGVGLAPIVAEPTGDRAADVARVTRQCIAQLEECIRAHPEQWHMPHVVWDQT